MNFDVVIPTKNRPEDLDRLIDSINESTVLPSNVIIIDQSVKIEKKICSDKYKVNHIHAKYVTGLCAAKNLGVSHCHSDVIHFFDDDIILDSDYFEIINQHLCNNPDIYGVCGRQKNSKSSRLKLAVFSLFHVGPFRDIRKKCNSGYEQKELVLTNILPGGITAYRKEIFDYFLFDEALIKYCLGEDMDFSYRASKRFKLAFATNALALHNHSQIGRYDPVESYACKVAGYSYFYEKNLSRSLKDRSSYYMVICGLLFDAASYTLKHGNTDAIKGVIKGWKYIKHRYEGVPFLDTDKIDFIKSEK